VRGWFWHPGWRQIDTPAGTFGANDIAVVVLDEPVRDVLPARIATSEQVTTAVARGGTGTVHGHGATQQTDPMKGGATDRLQQGTMKLLAPEQCAADIPQDSVGTSGFCTTGVPAAPEAPAPSICPGDSGGPLILSTPDGPRVAGVLSAQSGNGCDGSVHQGEFMNAADWQQQALRPNPELAPTGALRVAGTPAVGQRVDAAIDALTPENAAVSYSWYAEEQDADGFTYYLPIEGATGPSLTVPKDVAGKRLKCIATLSTPAGEVQLQQAINPVNA
jgi:hypothetical protein